MAPQPNLEEPELPADTLRRADGGLMPRESLVEPPFSLTFLVVAVGCATELSHRA